MNFNQQPYFGDPYYDDPYGRSGFNAYLNQSQNPFLAANNPYAQQPQPQQQGGGVNPLQAYRIYQNFSGGGGFGGGGGGGGGGLSGLFGGGGGAAGGGGAGGGSAGSAAGLSLGGWGALLGLIAGAEYTAKKKGRRPDSEKDHLSDIITGKNMEYDFDALADRVDGTDPIMGKSLEFTGKFFNPEGGYEMTETALGNVYDWFAGLF